MNISRRHRLLAARLRLPPVVDPDAPMPARFCADLAAVYGEAGAAPDFSITHSSAMATVDAVFAARDAGKEDAKS